MTIATSRGDVYEDEAAFMAGTSIGNVNQLEGYIKSKQSPDHIVNFTSDEAEDPYEKRDKPTPTKNLKGNPRIPEDIPNTEYDVFRDESELQKRKDRREIDLLYRDIVKERQMLNETDIRLQNEGVPKRWQNPEMRPEEVQGQPDDRPITSLEGQKYASMLPSERTDPRAGRVIGEGGGGGGGLPPSRKPEQMEVLNSSVGYRGSGVHRYKFGDNEVDVTTFLNNGVLRVSGISMKRAGEKEFAEYGQRDAYNTIGAKGMREILNHLKERHPSAEFIAGDRVGGMRQKAGTTSTHGETRMRIRKPEEVVKEGEVLDKELKKRVEESIRETVRTRNLSSETEARMMRRFDELFGR